jgi:hypothetical protein
MPRFKATISAALFQKIKSLRIRAHTIYVTVFPLRPVVRICRAVQNHVDRSIAVVWIGSSEITVKFLRALLDCTSLYISFV